MKKILFSGELPPKSIHGVAVSNEINIKILSERFEVLVDEEYVDLKYHGKLSNKKLGNFVSRLRKIFIYSIKNKFEFFYIVFSTSTAGAIKTLLIILFFRIFNFSSICIVHLHRGDLEIFINRKKINGLLFSFVLKLTHRFVVLSSQTKEYIQKQFQKNDSIFVLPNTINQEFFFNENTTKDVKKPFLKFIYISNYLEEKGILLLLETFHKLEDRFHLDCYGNFSDLKLKEKILSYSSNRISINAAIYGENKFLAIKESDALILPSYNEGKPIILLEALSIGTPFIVPDVGYIKEMVFENYPFVYGENLEENLLAMINKFSDVTEMEKIELNNTLKKHYFDNYSNAKHKEKLYQIFN